VPHAAHDGRLLGHDLELTGVDEVARGITQAVVAQRVVAPVTAGLEELALHPGHALAVEVALQLGGQAQLPEQVAPGGPVEAGAGQVGHEQRDLAALQLMLQVEHQPGVAREPAEVVHGDAGHLACGHRAEEGLVAVARRAKARLVAARVGDDPHLRARRQQLPARLFLQLVGRVGGGRLLVGAADVDEVAGHTSMDALVGHECKAHQIFDPAAGGFLAASPNHDGARLGGTGTFPALAESAASAVTSASQTASRRTKSSSAGTAVLKASGLVRP